MQNQNMSADGIFVPSMELEGLKTIPGRGRGRRIGIPTINIDLSDVPDDFPHGIYAGRVMIGGVKVSAAIHYGPRPVFKDNVAFEIHLIERSLKETPVSVDLEIVGRLRDVLDFETPELLLRQIERDIEETRAMLKGA